MLGLLLHFCMLTTKQKPQLRLMDHRRVEREKNVLSSSYIFKGLLSGSPFECHLSEETEIEFVKIRSLVTEENRGMGLRADPVSSQALRKSSFNVCPQTHNTKVISIKKRHMKKEYRMVQQSLSKFKMITEKELKRKLTLMVKEKECLGLKFPVNIDVGICYWLHHHLKLEL